MECSGQSTAIGVARSAESYSQLVRPRYLDFNLGECGGLSLLLYRKPANRDFLLEVQCPRGRYH